MTENEKIFVDSNFK